MRTPRELQSLIDDGIIDEVMRPLKSGKEATVWVVRTGVELRCAKVYKDMAQRSFQARTVYQEGRKFRGSRQARALTKGSRFGRKELEEQWKNTEADALFQFAQAGVHVPTPFGYYSGVLLMSLVVDDQGFSAPRLAEVELDDATARQYYRQLLGDVVRMLCLGFVHGDLSPFNVLVSGHGPIVIDFPQVITAAGNLGARRFLLRDVHSLRDHFAQFAPELAGLHHGEEMWGLYERGELRPDTELTGDFEFDTHEADVAQVLETIEDARQVALIRQQGREAAEAERNGNP